MIKKSGMFLFLMFLSVALHAQIPIEKFRKEISQLKLDSEKEEYCFEIVNLSNGNSYIKHGEYFQKLLLLEVNEDLEKYKIENEPFGWYYELNDDNLLKLLDHNNSVLIEYSQCNK